MNEPTLEQWSSTGREEGRTVVVSGVPDILPSTRMADKLVIHFQSSRSHGGDVEKILYPTHSKGVAFITFENISDAEMVIRHKQTMKDTEFPREYLLTVFKFTPDVFFYVNAEVDLSVFSDPSTLIQTLQPSHSAVRICPSQSQGRVSVEGPFTAVRALRQDLIKRAQTERSQAGPAQAVQSSQDDLTSSVATPSKETSSAAEDVSVWLDTNIFLYIQRFYKHEFDQCLRKHEVSARSVNVADLTQIVLSGTRLPPVSGAKDELELLVANWQSTLRTHRVANNQSDGHQVKLLQACEEASSLYKDVHYVHSDSHIEVIGPSFSSHRFCQMVKDRVNQMNGGWVTDGGLVALEADDSSLRDPKQTKYFKSLLPRR